MKHALIVPTLCDDIRRNVDDIISFIDTAVKDDASSLYFLKHALLDLLPMTYRSMITNMRYP
jgi:hypothetical protein